MWTSVSKQAGYFSYIKQCIIGYQTVSVGGSDCLPRLSPLLAPESVITRLFSFLSSFLSSLWSSGLQLILIIPSQDWCSPVNIISVWTVPPSDWSLAHNTGHLLAEICLLSRAHNSPFSLVNGRNWALWLADINNSINCLKLHSPLTQSK